METANSVISLAPSSKESIELFANQILSQVLEGDVNPLKVFTQIRDLMAAFDKIKDNEKFKQALMDEAVKYGGKSFEVYGHKVTISDNLGIKYGYAEASPIWVKLNEKLKEHEALLKSLKSPMTIVDTETGEAVTVTPPIKRASSGLKIEAQ